MFHDKAMFDVAYPASQCPEHVSCEELAHFAAYARCNTSSASTTRLEGSWFDEGFDLREPAATVLVESVLERIEDVETRNRKRRPVDQANHETLVRKLLANGLRCAHFHNPATVAIQRGAAQYRGKPQWLSGSGMARATDLLGRAGFADVTIGQRGFASSTFELTPTVLNLALETGITERSLTYRLPANRLVRLREGNRDSDQVAFEVTDETRLWTTRLQNYNAFLAKQDIGIDLTDGATSRLVERMNAEKPRGTMPFSKPELIKKDLYRQFNNGSFDQGGRLFGGWWINCPKDLRPKITINGKPTIELDYSGCMVRMLYHERGLDYEDDPYWLRSMDACERQNGLPTGHLREPVKRMMQALINGEKGKQNERIRMPAGQTFLPYFSRRAVELLLKDKHSPIAHAFNTGAGVRLQRIESNIALEILNNLMDREVVALPIHDSFIVPMSDQDKLRWEMKTVYKQFLNHDPVIK